MRKLQANGRLVALPLLFLLLLWTGCSDEGAPPSLTGPLPDPISFSQQIQALFNANCIGCHGLDGNAGLDLRAGMSHLNLVSVAAQASIGTLVVPGESENSVLLNRLQANGLGIMPPGGSLDLLTVELVQTWISEGALDN